MVNRHFLRFPVLLFALLLLGTAIDRLDAQTQITIGASKDNTLYEDVAGALSNGAGKHFFAGKTNSTALIRRGLVSFDVAGAIPANSLIMNATLTLKMSKTTSGPQTVELHRALEYWGEGTSIAAGDEGGGAPATTDDATWVHRFFNTALWSIAGGVSVATPSAALVVSDTGFYVWGSTADLVSDVQQWLNTPSNNHGWLLIGNEAIPATTKRFDSKDNTNTDVRPKLTVTYQPPVNVESKSGIPLTYALKQNYPNPFNPTTTIEYALPTKGHVTLKVFNLLGQEVATAVDEVQEAGNRSVRFSSNGLISGVYFYRLSSGSFTQTRSFVVLK